MSENIVSGNILYAGNSGSTATDAGVIGATILSGIDSYGSADAPTVYTVDTDIAATVGATYNAGAYSTLQIDDAAAVSVLTNFALGQSITLPDGAGTIAAGNGTLEIGAGLSIPVASTITFYGQNDTLILDSGDTTPVAVAHLKTNDGVVFKSVAYQSDAQIVAGGNAITGYYDQIETSGGAVLATVNTTTALPASDFGLIDAGGSFELIFCFLTGTRIRTPEGEAPIESLKIGDLLMTADGQIKPVRWIGINTVATRFADPLRVMPIRIRAGALDGQMPARDLLVSPDHALLVGGLLIQAGALINGVSIIREPRMPETFVYYHVELADHSLILAEGAAAETFIDNVDRMQFDNWAEYQALYGDAPAMVEMAYPRAKAARQVPARIKNELLARAMADLPGTAAAA